MERHLAIDRVFPFSPTRQWAHACRSIVVQAPRLLMGARVLVRRSFADDNLQPLPRVDGAEAEDG